jgi:exodeoxyribonuclease V gamma subunit
MLHLHFSNRLERLRAALLQRLQATRPADPFAAEQLIVPNAALRRHLSLGLADTQGICANLHFDYLAQWLWRQIARVVPGIAAESPFAADRLAWRVHAAFGDRGFVAVHPRLRAYLGEADELMRWELAVRVAGLMEQYVTYRADWLLAWQQGRPASLAAAQPDEAWQAALWRRIDAELGRQAQHPAQAFARALRSGGAQAARAAGLPAVAHLFALPGIAPLHLQLLQPLAQCIELHLYVLNPCREYWFDLVDARRLRALAARGRDHGFEEGQRLLTSWGRQTQSHVEALVGLAGDGVEDDADFEPAAGTQLLARLQNALLTLQPLQPGSVRVDTADRSIELHVCHSLTRELEVLHDHLLTLFAQDSQLRPGDVLVALPDLDAAAPLIDAVFGTQPKERALPYAICGGRGSRVDLPARCLLALLALPASRCTASEIFGLLQQPPVARRFGLDDEALAEVHQALREAGFHWALDGEQRRTQGLPGSERFTLDDALQRLFLGFAQAEGGAPPFVGRLGAGGAEGQAALALGALWRFARALQDTLAALRMPRLPADWALLLNGLLDRFVAADESEQDDLLGLRASIAQMVQNMHDGGVAEPLPLAVLRAALQARLEDPARGAAAGGSICFASMSGLRLLPFQVVCLLGLNDGAFPSLPRADEFDLIAALPRLGDRQRRDDDRGLMLDLLLAARRSLYLSHTGRSVRDNARLPPSVLVSELLDILLPALTVPPGDAAAEARAREQLVVEHPLQAFAPQGFEPQADLRLRSHDRELAQALRARLQAEAARSPPTPLPAESETEDGDDEDEGKGERAASGPRWPFVHGPLPPPGPEWRQLSLDTLAEFFRNPCRALLRRRLRIELPWQAEELLDDEPFTVDGRLRLSLAQRLLPNLAAGDDDAALRDQALAGTELPDGTLGDVQLQVLLPQLRAFHQRLDAAAGGPPLPPLSQQWLLQIEGEAWLLKATLETLRPAGLVGGEFRLLQRLRPLEAWLRHLVLCAAAPVGVLCRTQWLAEDGGFTLDPVAEPLALLQDLVTLYRQGLRAPLHFFPRAAWQLLTGSPAAARSAWRSDAKQAFAEGDDPAYQLALRGVDNPLDADFQMLAHRVYGPLLEHYTEQKA